MGKPSARQSKKEDSNKIKNKKRHITVVFKERHRIIRDYYVKELENSGKNG